ncbi:hypothetical protein ABLB69_17280 [Xenorhabdus khoisanae]|uniref:Uncharacterized protein n=1 Tax=Xenorhabdus khoisanae TaxID=880157 RepID=A0A0J5IMD2_9GAMM|nr:hypothetical protein [Xenorhabdus khoisanae]KMJ44325.1 hypothetical protein AB204_14985 [Xenorhabdus khoisanae]
MSQANAKTDVYHIIDNFKKECKYFIDQYTEMKFKETGDRALAVKSTNEMLLSLHEPLIKELVIDLRNKMNMKSKH